jgi:hypothetical protein
MPNLRTWSEAQLKRGYSKAQIKKHLARKGYPLKVVAEVDKLNFTNKLSTKANIHNKNSFLIILIFLLVVVLIVIGSYFFESETTVQLQPETLPNILPETPIEENAGQLQPGNLGEERDNLIRARLLGITENEFIIRGVNGRESVIAHDLPETQILVLKRKEDRSTVEINLKDIKIGSMVTITTIIQNNQKRVSEILVNEFEE